MDSIHQNAQISKSSVTTKTGESGVILQDLTKSGRERPWAKHKRSSVILAESFDRIGAFGKADRVRQCASVLFFDECPNGCGKTLRFANFCQVRLCPMCGWRRSLAAFHQVRMVAHHAALRRPNLAWLFLTLTVRNCEGEELKPTIDHLMRSWHLFTKYKAFDKAIVGWFRSFEVTRNAKGDSAFNGTYHPHFHVLLAVNTSYFKSRDYISQEQWTALWQRALRVDYQPIVRIQRVKGKRNPLDEEQQLSELTNGLLEVTKYATKSKDYLVVDDTGQIDRQATDAAVSVLDASLARRRLFAYGGLLKDVWNELRAAGEVQDVEDEEADLIHVQGTPTSCKCSVCQSDMLSVMYRYLHEHKNYISFAQ